MILILDNFDSFVYNLAQYIGELGGEPLVVRNDAITISQIAELSPTHIVISPGPCTPTEAGISNEAIREFAGRIPILGVCLGHQCIGHVFGAFVGHAKVPCHGKRSLVFHDGKDLYKGLPNPFEAGRYHSLVVREDDHLSALQVTSRTQDGTVMGIRHATFAIEGVQFHPESIMTPVGHDILRNFLSITLPTWQEEV